MILPPLAIWICVVASAVAFVAYAADKSAARRGGRRIPENALHALGVIGGWPGALVAQRAFHHKTRKPAFQIVFWLTVAAHCGVLAWWASMHRA